MRSNLAEAYPEYIPVRRKEKERIERVRRVKRAAGKAKNRKKVERSEMGQPFLYLLMLTAAVIVTIFICFNYLALKNSVTSRMDNIERLETTLENMRTENDALEQSIDTAVNLNEVYSIAVNELGMVHAGKDNIIEYERTENEYVKQGEDILVN